MSEEFGPNFITVTDEDGNDIELELLDVLEHNGQTYMAFFPAVLEEDEADEDSDDYGMVILKSITENGEELLSTLDSEEELTEVYDLFMCPPSPAGPWPPRLRTAPPPRPRCPAPPGGAPRGGTLP